MEYDKLKIKQTDFITKGIIGQGHFGEVSKQFIIHLIITIGTCC